MNLLYYSNVIDNGFDYLSNHFDVTTMYVRNKKMCMEMPELSNLTILKKCLSNAEKQLKKKSFDLFLGRNVSGIYWAIIYRLRGFDGHVVVYSDYNPVSPAYIKGLMILSQLSKEGAATVVTGSETSAEIFKSFRLSSQSIFHYGIDLSKFYVTDTCKCDLRKKLKLPLDKRIILYTGRGETDKRLDLLIRSFLAISKEIDDIALVLVTIFNNEKYLKKCQSMAGKNIYFKKNIFNEKLVRVYQASDLFVTCSTSQFETFGRSPLEAMACGVPSIVPSYDGFKEHIKENCAFKIDVLTDNKGLKYLCRKDLIGKIKLALTDKEKTEEIAENGIRLVKQYSSEKYNEKFVTFLKSLEKIEPNKIRNVKKKINLDIYPEFIKNMFVEYGDLDCEKVLISLISDRNAFMRKPEGIDEYLRVLFRNY